jgi:rod shape-determining protein MreD
VTGLRAAGLAALVLAAVAVQVAVLRHLAIDGVVPDVVLLLVVAAALLRGPEYAATLGFGSGLVLDLAPPADHVAGRWALALVVAGYLAGRVRTDARRSLPAALAVVAACSFVAGSLYALTGLVVGDDHVAAGQMLRTIAIGVGWDVVAALVVLPVARRVLRRTAPGRPRPAAGW